MTSKLKIFLPILFLIIFPLLARAETADYLVVNLIYHLDSKQFEVTSLEQKVLDDTTPDAGAFQLALIDDRNQQVIASKHFAIDEHRDIELIGGNGEYQQGTTNVFASSIALILPHSVNLADTILKISDTNSHTVYQRALIRPLPLVVSGSQKYTVIDGPSTGAIESPPYTPANYNLAAAVIAGILVASLLVWWFLKRKK